jgi:3-hydroxyisobutyrate dehydrogenase-like beta-hydroxyacid dehydrogenase
MDVKARNMVEGDFSVPPRLSQPLKDVRLILQAGAAAGLALPLSELHRQLRERAEVAGVGDRDDCAVIEVIRTARR